MSLRVINRELLMLMQNLVGGTIKIRGGTNDHPSLSPRSAISWCFVPSDFSTAFLR